MKIRPLADKVLVERLEAESVTAGGIVLPESAKEKPQRGKVISVGDGRLLDDGTRSKMKPINESVEVAVVPEFHLNSAYGARPEDPAPAEV